MTEASSRRPRELLEGIEEQVKLEEARPRLIFKISKQDIFDKTMAEWLISLTPKEKQQVTPLKLKRKALRVCSSLDFVYDNLSGDWIKKLEAIGLKLQLKEDTQKESKSSRMIKMDVTVPKTNDQKPALGERSTTYKKLVDLTKSTPPPFWLKNYAEGIILPRLLSIHSTDDANYLFYDYSPKLKDEHGKEVILKRRKRHVGHKMLPFETSN